MEWSRKKYNEYYNAYMPWIEDKVLGYWGENKTSYTAKDKMKTRVTGDEGVNKLQDGVAEGVGGQLGKGGLLSPVGEGVSDQGVTRAERGDTGPVSQDNAQGVGGQVKDGAAGVAGGVQKGVGGLLGGGGGGGDKK